MRISGRPESMTSGEWVRALQVVDGRQLGLAPVWVDGLVRNLVLECGSAPRALQVLVFVDRWYHTPWLDLLHSRESAPVCTAVDRCAPSPGRLPALQVSTRVRLVGRGLWVGAALLVPGWTALSILLGPR